MSISKDELLDRIDGRIELKSVDIAKNLSEETLAFTATVYFDGEIVGEAANRGRGGMTNLRGFRDGRSGEVKNNFQPLRDFVDSLPEIETSFGTMKYSAEALISFLANHADFMRTVKRKIRNDKIVFRTPEQSYGEFSYVGYNGSEVGAADMVYDRYDVDMMYNDVDTDLLNNA